MLGVIGNVVAMLFLFGLTIFIHELGHFLTARWLGLRAEVFSIGFGPAIWKKKVGDVVYKIGALPLGGYVSLPQMDPTGVLGNKDREEKDQLPHVAPWRRLIVATAGVAGNMVLAFFCAWLVYLMGKPSAPHERDSIIGDVVEDSRAWAEGVRPGQRILAVNGNPVRNWMGVRTEVSLAEDAVLELERPDGGTFTVVLPTEVRNLRFREIPGIDHDTNVVVGQVLRGSPAEAAGLQPMDRILSFNGVAARSDRHFVRMVTEAGETPSVLEVMRPGVDEPIRIPVTPVLNEREGRAMLGFAFSQLDVDFGHRVRVPPLDQIREHAGLIFRILRALVTPREAGMATQNLGGPVGVFYMFWLYISHSVVMTLWFTCLFNVNLAILNLLPIPILDGGHIMFALYEAITRRRVGATFFNWVSNIFALLLVTAMIALTVKDVQLFQLLWGRRTDAEQEERVEPVEPEEDDPVPKDEDEPPESGDEDDADPGPPDEADATP